MVLDVIMAPRYKCRGIRGKWTQENMQKALAEVKCGRMKIYTASKHFNIPRRTLKRYLAENKSKKASLGRKPLLSTEQEKDLKSRIIRLCTVGYPLTTRVLRANVKTYCDLNNIATQSTGIMIGRDWLRGFLKRHEDVRRRKAQNLNPARAQKLNKIVVADYFEKLKKMLEKNDLLHSPERIFNIDEKGCQLNLHKAPQVLAERGTKRVHIVGHEHAENVTVVSCGNALGQAIPPMILFKGKRLKPEWKDSLPNGTDVQMTPKGSMNVEAFVKWIHHLAKYKLPGPCLVVFDGAKCHLDYSIVEAADKFDIKLLCLPSNTTHELQPMDKSVFRSFEYFWDEEVLKYWAHHEDRRITKQRFGVIFSKVWDKAMTPANIKAGFEATGIYPFDPTKIPEEAYAPSVPSHVEAPDVLANESTEDISSSDDDIPLAALIPLKTKASTSLPCAANKSEDEAPVSLTNKVITVEVHTTPCSSKNTTNEDPNPVSVPVPSISPSILLTLDETHAEDLLSTAPSKHETPESLNVSAAGISISDNNFIEVSKVPYKETAPLAADDITTALNDITADSSKVMTAEVQILNPCPSREITNKDPEPGQFVISSKVDTIEASVPIPSISPTPVNDSIEVPVQVPSTSAQTNTSFKEMLKTPQKVSSPSVAPRKKAINSLAQELTKDTFEKKENRSNILKSNKRRQQKNKGEKVIKRKKGKAVRERPSNESWYCFVCQEDRVADMRLCIKCSLYVHEECVGLSATDKDNYICIRCED